MVYRFYSDNLRGDYSVSKNTEDINEVLQLAKGLPSNMMSFMLLVDEEAKLGDSEFNWHHLASSFSVSDGNKAKQYFVGQVEDYIKTGLKVCVICGKQIKGYGNNPEPVKNHGQCCDTCNLEVVIPARLKQIREAR